MPTHRLWMKSGASGRAINFNHPAIQNDRDDKPHRFHGKGYDPGFQHQGKQISQPRGLKLRCDVGDCRGNVDAGVGIYDTGTPLNHCLCNLENCDDEIKGMINDDCRRR